MSESKDYAKLQAEEWGQFVAKREINIDGARAFNPGHPVPASIVASHGLADAVERVATKTAAGSGAVDAEKKD